MIENIYPMSDKYEEYLIDESKFCGYAESISFPESEEEIIAILEDLEKEDIPVTIQGAKTGITGASVPQGGHILNLSHMNQVIEHQLNEDGTGSIVVEAGINLMDLCKEISTRFRKNPLFWPPDPTETSASIGGIAATGAQGISQMLYGPSQQYIEAVRLAGADGKIMEIKRGQEIELPSGEKMDAIDAVLGKEGITGVITRLTLKLLPKPESVWGIVFFFGQTEEAGQFVDMLRGELPVSEEAAVAAVEYMDRVTMDLIEARKETMTKIKELPDIPEEIQALVYVEIQGNEEGIEELAEMLMGAAMECGSDPDAAWAVSGETDVERLHAFRHGAAETANLYIEERRREEERITKLGTDMMLGEQSFSEILADYEADIEKSGLKGCVFGHALENHLHINLLPADYDEYEKGIELIKEWAEKAKEKQGKVIVEHGIGKLKRKILGTTVSAEYLELCHALKDKMDAGNRFNRGNIFE